MLTRVPTPRRTALQLARATVIANVERIALFRAPIELRRRTFAALERQQALGALRAAAAAAPLSCLIATALAQTGTVVVAPTLVDARAKRIALIFARTVAEFLGALCARDEKH